MTALLSIVLFFLGGGVLVVTGMLAVRLVSPRLPHPTKSDPYECGEAPVGTADVQFDLRFYIVALVYLIFAVEVVLFYPWAVAYGSADVIAQSISTEHPTYDAFTLRAVALVDMLVFFGLLVVGFLYLWRFGYLNWIRAEPKAESNG